VRSVKTFTPSRQETADTPELTARLAAVQIVAVQWTLAQDNAERLAYRERHPGAVADAEHAFALLENGLRHLAPQR
jgi:hypothetical protein